MRRWRLDPREVISGYASGLPPETGMSGFEGEMEISGYAVWLEHRPTGLRVEGAVPDGRHSARSLQLLEIELRKSLFAELELKVARHKGVSGV